MRSCRSVPSGVAGVEWASDQPFLVSRASLQLGASTRIYASGRSESALLFSARAIIRSCIYLTVLRLVLTGTSWHHASGYAGSRPQVTHPAIGRCWRGQTWSKRVDGRCASHGFRAIRRHFFSWVCDSSQPDLIFQYAIPHASMDQVCGTVAQKSFPFGV